jgi:hypothetical protein
VREKALPEISRSVYCLQYRHYEIKQHKGCISGGQFTPLTPLDLVIHFLRIVYNLIRRP